MAKKKEIFLSPKLNQKGPTKNILKKLDQFYVEMLKKKIVPLVILTDFETHIELINELGARVQYADVKFKTSKKLWSGVVALPISKELIFLPDSLLKKGTIRTFVKKSKKNPKTGCTWVSSHLEKDRDLQELNYIE